MEVVVVDDLHVVATKVTTHNALGVLNVPWGTVVAGDISRVDKLTCVARLLSLVITLHNESINKRLNHLGGGLDIKSLLFAEDNLVNELNHVGSNQLVCLVLGNVRDEVTVSDGAWGLSGHELGVGNTFKSHDGEEL